jgi:hypothetical protein
MTLLILTCYSAYATDLLQGLVDELSVSDVLVWHPLAYRDRTKNFEAKSRYLMNVYTDLVTRARKLKRVTVTSSNDLVKYPLKQVYAFKQLVYAVDQQLKQAFKSRIHVLKPLQYVYNERVIEAVRKRLGQGRGVRLQAFLRYMYRDTHAIAELLQHHSRLARLVMHSTDSDNRSSIPPTDANRANMIQNYDFPYSPNSAREHLV